VIATALAAAAAAAWLWLLCARGGFWLARERDDRGPPPPEPAAWPAVVAVVPARDEADVVGRAIGSLLRQDYPGDFRVVLVDDDSGDGTAVAARAAGAGVAGPHRLEVVAGAPLPHGWTGKLWALRQGVERAAAARPAPEALLLTDADIEHAPDNLRRLVARLEADRLALVSLMAELRTDTFAERLLIPAFVFFFGMLYPFGRVNDPARRTAAAAGGCMLVRRAALDAAGGIAAVRGEIIDDCALAARLARLGPIRLELTRRARSLRGYGGFGEIAAMVSRSAYAQLRFSPARLAAAVAGMGLVYVAPPLLTLLAGGPARLLGGLAWLAMAIAFQPTLRFYRRSPLWGPALPLIGLAYAGFTVASAAQFGRGRGGWWKGRAQAPARSS
jgi:hopene-associated glycosyltransferase HpnB